MKKIIFLFLTALVIVSCLSDKKATVKVSVSDAPDSTQIIVSKLAINQVVNLDTLYIINHTFTYSTECAEGSPDFYYFFNNERRLFSLVLQSGDRIKVKTDLKGEDVVIDGSEESVKFQEVERQFLETYGKFSSLSDLYVAAEKDKNDKLQKEYRREMGGLYVKQKQYAIKYIFSNPKSITVIPVVYQKFSPELILFAESNDVFLLERTYDSLKVAYPHSPYTVALADEIQQRKSIISLNQKISSVKESNYPDISLYDNNAQIRSLSDLDGKVILLSFWTITEDAQKLFNAELKSIYDKYHSRGFEIFQVSVDADKTAWARQVKDQGLKWISVSDPGNMSQTLNLYNVSKLPALFIIDRQGNIHAKDVVDIDKIEKIVSGLVR